MQGKQVELMLTFNYSLKSLSNYWSANSKPQTMFLYNTKWSGPLNMFLCTKCSKMVRSRDDNGGEEGGRKVKVGQHLRTSFISQYIWWVMWFLIIKKEAERLRWVNIFGHQIPGNCESSSAYFTHLLKSNTHLRVILI